MKRAVASVLWGFSFWYLGSIVALALGVPDALGPALGLAAGSLIAIDPRRQIWVRAVTRSSTSKSN